MKNKLLQILSSHLLWPYGEAAFKRVLEVLPEETVAFLLRRPEAAKQLLKICVSSTYLTNLLVRRPELVAWLFLEGGIEQTRTRAEFLTLLKSIIGKKEFPELIRAFKAKELLRIWARDLNQLTSLEASLKEWSDLASACLQAIYEHVLPSVFPEGPPTSFFIFGLGKLGAEELNYYSDIDLVYFYESNENVTRNDHQLFVKLAEKITSLCHHPQYGEVLFKVDLNLRPGGKESEIIQSTRAAEIYYENFGTALERLALLRARPIAGDLKRGRAFLDSLTPFIYRRYFDFSGVDEIRSLKRALDFKSQKEKRFNLKIGQGGIRELEFFVHTLQLIYGGRFPELRQHRTFAAITALKNAKLIRPEDADFLCRAYRYLRRLEHLCQMAAYTQTHTLPRDRHTLLKIARLMGYGERREEIALRHFFNHLRKIRSGVHAFFKELLATKEEGKEEEVFKILFTHTVLEKEAISYLKQMGFKHPERSYERIMKLKGFLQTPHVSGQSHRLLLALLPRLLQEVQQTINPDLALIRLEEFISRLGPRTGFYALLKENPTLRRLVLQIFGASELLSSLLIKHFQLFDQLISASQAKPIKTRADIEATLQTYIRCVSNGHTELDLEEKIEALRQFKNEELLRIGFADLAGKLSPIRVSQQLTAVADVALAHALIWAKEEVNKKMSPLSLPFLVVALGKLGSQEMAYHSDLDLIFIYDYPPEADLTLQQQAHLYFVKLAQRLISILTVPHAGGPGYEVDTRLRPSGRFGPLVVSFPSFKEYYQKQAMPWERQTLLKARWVCGDQALGEAWEKFRHFLLFEEETEIDWRQEISHMRQRILEERAKETEGKFNLKLGKGGLIEVEFLAQYFQLIYGPNYPEIRRRHTFKFFKALKEIKLIPADDVQALMEGYSLFKALEHRLNLVYNRSSELPLSEDKIKEMWQNWGLKEPPLKLSPEEALAYLQDLRMRIRKIWEKYLPDG